MGKPAHERSSSFFIAEEANGGAFEFLVRGGVAEFVVIFKSESVFVDGKGDQMVGCEFKGEVFAKNGNRGLAAGGSEGVVV
jgi:hypothetical protein